MQTNVEENATVKQYRVVFTETEMDGGAMHQVTHSTKWFDSLDEARQSHWMKCENARVVVRDYAP